MEELLSETVFRNATNERQSEIIAHHCSMIEKKIMASIDMIEAQAIVAAECEQFRASCSSSIIRSLMIAYVEELYRKKWGNRNGR